MSDTKSLDELIAKVLGISEQKIADSLAYLSVPQWDSMKHMNLMLALEKSYGVKMKAENIVELTTVAAIRRFTENLSRI